MQENVNNENDPFHLVEENTKQRAFLSGWACVGQQHNFSCGLNPYLFISLLSSNG
jgi:hypothetical protein